MTSSARISSWTPNRGWNLRLRICQTTRGEEIRDILWLQILCSSRNHYEWTLPWRDGWHLEYGRNSVCNGGWPTALQGFWCNVTTLWNQQTSSFPKQGVWWVQGSYPSNAYFHSKGTSNSGWNQEPSMDDNLCKFRNANISGNKCKLYQLTTWWRLSSWSILFQVCTLCLCSIKTSSLKCWNGPIWHDTNACIICALHSLLKDMQITECNQHKFCIRTATWVYKSM